MAILLEYAWCIFIFSAIISAVRLKRRIQPYINANYALENGYNKIIIGRAMLVTLPWVIVAIGCMTKKTHDFSDFLYPRQLNPVVLIFYFVILLEALSLFYWIFLDEGARYLKKHPGSIRLRKRGFLTDYKSSSEIKRVFFRWLITFCLLYLLFWLLPLPVVHFN